MLVPYVGDNDFWFHLRIGEAMWEERVFPRTEMFSFTAADMPWTNHEWLVQLTLYATYAAFGFGGVGILVGLIGAAMAGAMLWEHRQSLWSSLLLVFLSFAVLRPFFVPRPQIFAYALLLALILVLARYYRAKITRTAWGIPAIMLVWGNVHASVLIGAGVLGVVVATEFVRRFSGRSPGALSPREFRTLATVSAVGIVASLINPFFHQVYVYALQPLWYAKAYHSLIETKPIFQNLNHTPVLFALLGHLALGGLFGWFLIRRRGTVQLYEKVLFVIFFLAPFASVKYVPFAWMAMLPVVLRQLPEDMSMKKHMPYAVAMAACAAIGFAQPWAAIGVDPHRDWPKGLLAFANERKLEGNIYNSYTWGGYMMWESKDRPVFIWGGFAGFYERNYFDSLDFAEGKRVDELIAKYDFSVALARPWETLAYTLSLKDDWQLVYWDNFGMIFVRKDGKNDTVLKEEGMTIKYINDAVDAMVRKYPAAELPQLERNLRRVIERNPNTLLARYRLGYLYKAAGRCDMAIEQFKAVITLDYRLGGAHGRLAECYTALGMPELARQEQEFSRQYAEGQRWWYGRP